MCVVSMVSGYGKTMWPDPNRWVPEVPPSYTPDPIVITRERQPTAAEWAEFLELVRKAEEFDRLTGQPDCVDPEKDAWLTAAIERMEEIQGIIDDAQAALDDLWDEIDNGSFMGTEDVRDTYELGN